MKGQIKSCTVRKIRRLMALGLLLCMCLTVFGDWNVILAEAREETPVYKIMVNRAANCVTVYEQDENGEFSIPVKAFVCSCGREGHATPLGKFKTSDYYPWRMMVDGSYGQYAVRFYKGIMFHSIPYYTKNAGNMEWEQFNLLGQAASLGCVRLACADAKWIYDNCKKGTIVEVYDDAENPGPLGKPEEMKITEDNPMRKWDPTDTNSENPWNLIRPSLKWESQTGDNVLYVPVGASVHDIYNAVKVQDPAGKEMDIQLEQYTVSILGNYDLDTAGVYKVSVRGVCLHGMRSEQEMTLCVIG